MIKTLTNLFKQDKEKFVVPKGVQDVIPVVAIFDDGIFKVGKDKYSKTYRFTDINYAVASREDKEAMFLEYSELLNSLDSGATTKITINNRRLNRLDFEQTILIPTTGDNLDEYREEYNKMLLDKATGANSIVQDKYITISINKKSVEDARTYFARVGADLIAHFGRLGSKCVELETDERLRIFHDFYRVGEESSFHFDIKETRKKGHDFKDYICPDTMEFEKDYFKMGNRYGRVLFLREYASYIKDSMVAELTDMNRNLLMSIDIVPVPTDEAVKEAENRLLGVETNITNWQRRQNANNNFSATVPYDMEQQKKEMKEFLDDLTTRDQRMMFAVITMVITADSKEQLENDTEALLTTARKHLCQFATLRFQQVDGLNTVMPFGTRKIDAFRTLTTESLSVFIPFRVQDIFHENGIYYGQNVISKNMIIADRKQLLNGNSFILGVSGGGKSFAAKGEIINQVLSSDADVIIIDPEREYSRLVNAMGGEVINISATSDNHINAMDMNKDYGDGANPVILKSEFIMSLCEQLIGGTNLGAKQNGIEDPEYSIQCGVQELKAALTSAEVESPIDMEHIKLALQGYNFGNGYISWAKTNYGGYSYANAVEFSTQQAQRLGWDSYGDTQYPAHVLRYYPYGRAFTAGGNQAIVEVALTQLGNQGGQPYWSWYGFNSRVEWCACFVSWCADQCGYIESGLVPKFAGCVDGANWFKSNGKWQDRTYEPKAGDIIFFDWEGDGTTDHVGIVEKCENGTVYTVEGNSGDACKQRQYAVGSSNIYGYGIPAY